MGIHGNDPALAAALAAYRIAAGHRAEVAADLDVARRKRATVEQAIAEASGTDRPALIAAHAEASAALAALPPILARLETDLVPLHLTFLATVRRVVLIEAQRVLDEAEPAAG